MSKEIIGINNRRHSTQPPSQKGTTKVHVDLWSKNSTQKSLFEQTEAMIKEIASQNSFSSAQNAKKIEKALKKVVRHYTTSMKFNEVMFLLKYMDLKDNIPKHLAADYITAKRMSLRIPLEIKADVRAFMFLTTYCSYKEDLVVYRGLADRRNGDDNYDDDEDNYFTMPPDKQSKSKSRFAKQVSILKEIEDYQAKMQAMFYDPLDWTVMINDEEDIEYVIRDLQKTDSYNERTFFHYYAEFLKCKLDFGIMSRDIQSLLNARGDQIVTESFMSTTLAIEKARIFAGADCCMLEIRIPAGTNCFYATTFSHYQGHHNEFEIVLPPCARLSVLGSANGVTRLYYHGVDQTAKNRAMLYPDQLNVLAEQYNLVNKMKSYQKWLKSQSTMGLTKPCRPLNRPETVPVDQFTYLSYSNDPETGKGKERSQKEFSFNWMEGNKKKSDKRFYELLTPETD